MPHELDLLSTLTLLVTFTPGDAMRQPSFLDREIKFSRLTPIDLEEGQTLGAMIAEETTRPWQYLDSLRNFTESDRLEVCVLVHPHDRPAVQPALRDFAQIQYRILDMDQVAANLGLKPPPLDATAEELIIHLSLLRRAQTHFAAPELRRFAMLRRARMVVGQVSVALLVASLAFGGWNVWRVLQSTEAEQRVSQQLSSLKRETEEITRALPSFGVGGSTMRDAVTFYNASMRGFPNMIDFLVPLSQVLRAHPEVRLTQVTWQATDDPKSTPKMQAMAPRVAPPVKSLARRPEGQAHLRAGGGAPGGRRGTPAEDKPPGGGRAGAPRRARPRPRQPPPRARQPAGFLGGFPAAGRPRPAADRKPPRSRRPGEHAARAQPADRARL